CLAGPHIYGDPADVYHNIVAVSDADGRPLLTLTYQTDNTKFDFDKVIGHTQGSGIPDSTMTFEYYDAAAYGAFTSRTLCPGSSTQAPKYVVVTHDLRGVTRVDWYDAGWRILRAINQTANLMTDYNYKDGFVSGVAEPSGKVTCVVSDGFGKPTLITENPS